MKSWRPQTKDQTLILVGALAAGIVAVVSAVGVLTLQLAGLDASSAVVTGALALTLLTIAVFPAVLLEFGARATVEREIPLMPYQAGSGFDGEEMPMPPRPVPPPIPMVPDGELRMKKPETPTTPYKVPERAPDTTDALSGQDVPAGLQ